MGSDIFSPLQLGDLMLPNRIVMAPMTRLRAENTRPTAIMSEYYRQRASAGLIVTEGIAVSPMGIGYAGVPGLWTEEHARGWLEVTTDVHAAGGRIVAQLWHVGRVSHSSLLDGRRPLAPSAVAPRGRIALLRPEQTYEVPHALGVQEIAEIVRQFGLAARLAMEAGFDGVELHAANGYLIDQFLQDGANRRSDDYGGSLENRLRFLREIVEAITATWSLGRIGVHLSLRPVDNDIWDSDPRSLFAAVFRTLCQFGIAYITAREAANEDSILASIRHLFRGAVIANDGFDAQSAGTLIDKDIADAVAFGRPFIANPDLVARFRQGLPLDQFNIQHLMFGGPRGYVDYGASSP